MNQHVNRRIRFALPTVGLIAADIKLAHSVFAMPFAILAACMASTRIVETSEQAFWPGIYLIKQLGVRLALVVLAMIFARTVAMLANRLLDRHIDKDNPRTASRAIPSGRVRGQTVVLTAALCAIAFISICALFGWIYDNWWPLILSPLVLSWISVYGLFKRFTVLCHVWLGSSLAISPIAAAIAINPHALANQPSLWLLSGMVLCWVAGFDIIYALQDVEVDRAQNLHSIPSKVGIPGSLWISRLLHLAAAACLIACWRIDPRFGTLFGVGIVIVCALLLYEHLTVARWGTTRIALAFFTLNGVISCILGLLGVIDILVI